jgi:hypothetical protein
MFILNPDPYSLPAYRIGPFRTSDLSINHCLPDNDLVDDYFNERFGHNKYEYVKNGRQAINIALGYYKLKEEDVVTILTTTNNFYISGCVTREIEKFCKWSRKILPETKLIFVNHEFGFPFSDLNKLKVHNLPIIEDCAGSFFSQDVYKDIGNIGDFVIYSFPKMFPLQIGGLLVSNLPNRIDMGSTIDNLELRYIKNILSFYINYEKEIIKGRIYNYNYLNFKFEALGFKERFQLKPGIVPGVFMFLTGAQKIVLPELKKYFYEHGIQCSVFYGEEAFFIPVHQALNEHDLDYFSEVMITFIKKSSI